MAFTDGQSDEPPTAKKLNRHRQPRTAKGTLAIAAAVLPVVRIDISRLIDHLKAAESYLPSLWIMMHH